MTLQIGCPEFFGPHWQTNKPVPATALAKYSCNLHHATIKATLKFELGRYNTVRTLASTCASRTATFNVHAGNIKFVGGKSEAIPLE